jgi:hypothetical protein
MTTHYDDAIPNAVDTACANVRRDECDRCAKFAELCCYYGCPTAAASEIKSNSMLAELRVRLQGRLTVAPTEMQHRGTIEAIEAACALRFNTRQRGQGNT